MAAQPLAERRLWRALGVAAKTGALPPDDRLGTLVEPDGPGGPAYLTFANYRPIMRYNCSNYYALTVGELADGLRNNGPPAALGTGRPAVIRAVR